LFPTPAKRGFKEQTGNIGLAKLLSQTWVFARLSPRKGAILFDGP
jgi:hypothetical protein